MGTIYAGLADSLFPKARQRVLGLLFGSPDKSFYLNDIVRNARTGTGAIQRELESLTKAGLLTVTKLGNQKHYQANARSPIFHELRGIIAKTFGVADTLRAALGSLRERIETAFIYGSMANGTARADSDIDLMVISSEIAYPDLLEALKTSESELARPINPTVYKPEEFRRKLKEGNAFLNRVMERPRIYLIGGEGDVPKSGQSRKNRQPEG